ncbi:MAG: hypothetical protein PUF50_02040 [Erysipelotrichaceae bacterium]|nr:hypothetical protein [Erysipelotrichaceae bacterium]
MAKLTVNEYSQKLQEMKVEAHNKQWLYIEVNAKELMNAMEPGEKNINNVCKAIYDALLEGDRILVKPTTKTGMGVGLTVRYYVDNLSESRKKYDGEVF